MKGCIEKVLKLHWNKQKMKKCRKPSIYKKKDS